MNLRLQKLQKIIESSLPDLLGAIRNHPPGVLEEEFIHGPRIGGITIGGFRIQWWIVDDQPFYKLALELTRCEPSLSDRHSVDEAAREIIRAIRENLDGFNFSPFLGSRQPPTTLLKCASPKGWAAVTKGIFDLVCASDRAIFLFPVRRLRPETDVISPSLVWLTRSAPKHLIEQLPQASDPRLAFDRFPPLLDGEALQDEDSMLGLIANGWQGAVTALRRLAGAVCLILPYHEATAKSLLDEQVGATAALFDDGRIEIRALGPFLPLLVNPILVKGDSVDCLGNLMKLRSTEKRENRFRVALEFLALGWLFQGSQAFMNWCIAIDALFGVGGTNEWKQSIKEGVQKMLPGYENRVALLVDIRSDLLHGRYSRISSSKKSLLYWERFQCDPLRDAFYILRECLIREP